MSPRETIAKAACEAILWPGAWDKMPDAEKEIGYARADAVIDALASMEPTEAMLDAACSCSMDIGNKTAKLVWQEITEAMRE